MPVDAPIRVELTSFAAREPEIKAIRIEVFHREQQIELALDFDGLDEEAVQVLAYINERPVGTARTRLVGEAAKIERVAVLAPYRNRGAGAAMVVGLLADLQQRGITNIILSAQCTSESFYRKLGFLPHGDVFQEAGIEHIRMRYRPPIGG